MLKSLFVQGICSSPVRVSDSEAGEEQGEGIPDYHEFLRRDPNFNNPYALESMIASMRIDELGTMIKQDP